MSVSRTRSRQQPATPLGTRATRRVQYLGGLIIADKTYPPTIFTQTYGDYDTSYDFLSTSTPYPDHPLLLTTRKIKSGKINGSGETPTPISGYKWYYNCSDWSHAYVSNRAFDYTTFPTYDQQNDINMSLTNLNINTPVVDLPLFMYELMEVPKAMWDIGRYLRKEVTSADIPGAYLTYNYGVAPLIRDMQSVLNIASAIDYRIKYLRAAKSGKKIRGSLRSHSDSSYKVFPNPVEIFYMGSGLNKVSMKATRRVAYKDKAWFVATLRASEPAALDDLIDMFDTRGKPSYERMNYLFGLRPSFNTLWNAYPWSFVVDYFLNVSNWLSASRGNTPYRVTSLNVMNTRSLSNTSQVSSNDTGLSFTSHNNVYTEKRRAVVANPSPMLPFMIPSLDSKTITNLGALTLSRLLYKP